MTELSKKDKKAARLIIEKGLQTEFKNGIIELEKIIVQWRGQEISNKEAWSSLGNLAFDPRTVFNLRKQSRMNQVKGSNNVHQ